MRDRALSRRDLIGASAASAVLAAAGGTAAAGEAAIPVVVDLTREAGPLEHVWSRCAGSDRAAITLREDWRHDLERVRREAGIERVRFHGIFNDELGVWTGPGVEIGPPAAVPNFQDVDAVYDGLLDRGVQPYVELSFMPGRLASGDRTFGFYRGDITPPASLADWSGFIQQFVRHLIARYGAAEVRQWMFEVWNEPNLPFFWTGTQAQYFDLYKATAAALKGVDPALRVGGPATSAVQWIPEFLAWCGENGAPVDFLATHVYPADDQAKIFGQGGKYSQNDVIPAAMAQVRAQIDASRFKGIPLWLSEWSSDSPAMIAHVITGCLPYCQAMSQWAMSNEFEEIFVDPNILREGSGNWGMLARRGIPRPAFNTYKLLNRLGRTQLAASGPALATRTAQGGAAVMVWNLAETSQLSGIPGATTERTVRGAPHRYAVKLGGAKAGQGVRVSYVDQVRGSPTPAWRAMGSPQYPTRVQFARIRQAAELAPPEVRRLDAAAGLTLDLPPEGVALIELGPSA
jgi:xylan 1,4-beta-xylosidase